MPLSREDTKFLSQLCRIRDALQKKQGVRPRDPRLDRIRTGLDEKFRLFTANIERGPNWNELGVRLAFLRTFMRSSARRIEEQGGNFAGIGVVLAEGLSWIEELTERKGAEADACN